MTPHRELADRAQRFLSRSGRGAHTPRLREALERWLGFLDYYLEVGDPVGVEESLLYLRAVYGELTSSELEPRLGPWPKERI
jgi:hypothetical protein